MTLEQVGQIIGVTKERVRQIQNKAMEKIRLELESKFLGTKKAEEEAAAAAAAAGAGQPGAQPSLPGQPGQQPPKEQQEELMALN